MLSSSWISLKTFRPTDSSTTTCWHTTSGLIFCLLLGVSSDYAQPITGQVTEVTCPVIGRAQPELTQSEQETENGPWTGTISIALVCYLLTSPWSASISIMSVPELFIVLLKGPLHCCIQETDGNCGHDDQSGRGWPWTDHQLSHRTSVDGYSLGACLPTCSGSNDDQSQSRTSACSARYTAATDFCRPCWQRHALPYAWSPPRWENTFWLDDRQ